MSSPLTRLLPQGVRHGQLFLANLPKGNEDRSKHVAEKFLKKTKLFTGEIPLRFTPDIETADAVLVAIDLYDFRRDKKYLAYLNELSHRKILLIFNIGDFSPKKLNITNVIYLKVALHPGENREDKIIIPYPIDRVNIVDSSETRTNLVSFVGFAPRLLSRRILYTLKNSPMHLIKGNGAIVRKIMVQKIKKSSLQTQLILRTEYGGKNFDNSLEAKLRRDKFVSSILGAKYVLCPRGDSNQSQRFFEVLSAGRVPVVIDTSMCFPEVENVNYSEFIISLKLSKSINTWDRQILEFDKRYSDEKFDELSDRIRGFFDENLDYPIFFKKLFRDFLTKDN